MGGEFRRRRSQPDEALVSYEAAKAYFDRAVALDPTTADSANHYGAMGLAGMARVRFEQGDPGESANLLVASFEVMPTAANALDGLNASGVTTAWLVLAKLKELEQVDQAAKLQAGLDRLKAIDPRLLAPPDFEKVPNTPEARNRDRRGRRRR